jgi:DNA-binding transcriptional MerR regulator
VSEIEATAEARYKVAEVCRLADVQPYVLKYWESEFPVLAVPKGASGPRLYSEFELKVIERIKKLLYDEGYTIAGAKKRLEAEMKDQAAAPAEPEPLVLTPPPLPQEALESTGTKRRRAKAAAPPPPDPIAPAEPEPPAPVEPVAEPVRAAEPESQLELADEPVFSTHPASAPPELSSPLEIDESGATAADVETTPVRLATRPVPAVRDVSAIDPAPAPMAQSPDPRVAMALAELREIASLLSREEV